MSDNRMTTREAASYLGFAEATLKKWRLLGRGPVFRRAGETVWYRRAELDAWLESLKVCPDVA